VGNHFPQAARFVHLLQRAKENLLLAAMADGVLISVSFGSTQCEPGVA